VPGSSAESRGDPAAPEAFPPESVGPPSPARSVAIVNDQPITRGGLEQLAVSVPGLTVAASVDCVEDLEQLDATYDVVMIDVAMVEDSLSLKPIARMAEFGRPLVISGWDRPPSLLSVVRAGACGCVTRQSSHQTVACALCVVASGGFYLCDQLVARFHHELNRPPRADPHGLAPREVETLQWIARGLTHMQIASQMGLSQATINTYAKRIRGKLKVTNKAELTRIAMELGHFGDNYHDPFAA
jgi:DNA-binding NarL/FixJ family response regulator